MVSQNVAGEGGKYWRGGTYNEDIHATRPAIDVGDGLSVGAEGEDDDAEDDDGDLDVKQPERLGRDAGGEEALGTHCCVCECVIRG